MYSIPAALKPFTTITAKDESLSDSPELLGHGYPVVSSFLSSKPPPLAISSSPQSAANGHGQTLLAPAPPPRKKHASKPKVRSGCITCQIRRVKCDEGKPACNRCAKADIKCHGYVKDAAESDAVFHTPQRNKALLPRPNTAQTSGSVFIGSKPRRSILSNQRHSPTHSLDNTEVGHEISWSVKNSRDRRIVHELSSSRVKFRQKFLQSLTRRSTSWFLPLQRHTIKMRILNWALFEHKESGVKNSTPRSFDSMVVACCGGKLQAISIEEYMAQTWPLTWYQILSLIRATENNAEVFVTNLPDGTRVVASAEHGHLVVGVSGPFHTIIECAEQLAWLHAALQSPSVRLDIQQTPTIADPVNVIDSSQDQLWESMQQCLGRQADQCFDVKLSAVNHILPLNHRQLELMFPQGLVIVAGYPILRRPEECHGFEISPEFLLQSWQPHPIDMNRWGAKIPSTTPLSLVQQENGFYIWHETQSPGQICRCGPQNSREFDAKDDAYSARKLLSGRHFVERCSNQGRTPEISFGRFPDFPDLIRDSSSIVAASLTCKEVDIEEDSDDTEYSADSAEFSDFSMDKALLHVENQLDLANLEQAECSESSFDSDWLPSSESSGSTESWDDDSPIPATLEAVINRIMIARPSSGFRSVAGGQASTDGDAFASTALFLPSEQSETSTSGGRNTMKRRRDRNDDPDSDEDEQNKRSNKSSKLESASPRSFACPFWVLEPRKHTRCIKYKLSRIGDVKQHLNRRHMLHFYCRCCLEVFPDKRHLNQHAPRADGFDCQLAPPGRTLRFKGIVPEISKSLSKKSKEPKSEDQWFAIWNILFPGQPQPVSPYLDYSLSEEIRLLRREVCLNGGGMILQELQKTKALEKLTPQDRRDLRKTFDRATELMFEECCIRLFTNSELRGQQSGISSYRDSSSEPRYSGTPVGSFTDSGVGMEIFPKTLDKQPTDLALPISKQEPRHQPQHNVLPTANDVVGLEQIPEKDKARLRGSRTSKPGFSNGMQYVQTGNCGVDIQIEVTPNNELEEDIGTQLCRFTLPSGTSGDGQVPIDWNEHIVGDQSFLGFLGFTEEGRPQIDESQARLEYSDGFELL